MRIGAERLLQERGSPLGVAESLLEGKLGSFDQQFVSDLVDPIILEAARIRIEWKRAEELKKETK